jgi:hypothetical protein
MRTVAAILLVFFSATILSDAIAQPANDTGLPEICAHRGASRVADFDAVLKTYKEYKNIRK